MSRLQANKQEVAAKLQETKYTLQQLKHMHALEKYAREEKLFKREDEDIFVITNE
jgi:hypothetical protein